MTRRPWIVAHRGARVEAPENTAAAFERALALPVDGIELDVQMSADGVPVLHHDRSLRKVAGSRRQVAHLTWERLQTIDAGSWFSGAYAGEPLPDLARVLATFAGRTRLFIEVKVFASDRRSGRNRLLVEKVLQLLERPEIDRHRDRIRILSFDLETLRYARELSANRRYVLDLTRAGAKRIRGDSPESMAHIDALCLPCPDANRPRVAWAHERGLEVFAYTCNDAATLDRLLDARCDGILTDDPAWLGRAMERRGLAPPGD